MFSKNAKKRIGPLAANWKGGINKKELICSNCDKKFHGRHFKKFCSSKCYWENKKGKTSTVKGMHWKIKDTSKMHHKGWNRIEDESLRVYSIDWTKTLRIS